MPTTGMSLCVTMRTSVCGGGASSVRVFSGDCSFASGDGGFRPVCGGLLSFEGSWYVI